MKQRSFSVCKRMLSAFLASVLAACALLCSGCSLSRGTTAVVNGTPVSDDVLLYFLDKAVAELGEAGSLDEVKKQATALLETYYKTNTLALKEGITLTTAQKAAVSERVNAWWGVYGEYEQKIGVTKETLTKVFTAEAYRDRLLLYYFDAGGPNEIGDTTLYANFRTNYIVFHVINGYFTKMDADGKTVRLAENEIEEIVLRFQNMEALLNDGEKTMEEAAAFLAAGGYTGSASTVVLKKGSSDYPAGFFEKVQRNDAGKASVIGTKDYIFLVVREDAGTDSTYYADKKKEILTEITGDEIDRKIAGSLQTETKLDSANVQSFYLLIQKEREA